MSVRELVVLSGKGGTGKTSIVGSFAALAGSAVLADCDVDAADLHLIMSPTIRERRTFTSGHQALIDAGLCTGCGACRPLCRFDAIQKRAVNDERDAFRVDPVACEGCGVCADHCRVHAIAFPERVCGEWFVSETRCGTMVHARLGIAAENSGKLVSLVRREARRIAESAGAELILVDGPPGIGCPVIASVTGATGVLAVTEPTVSGQHDLDRLLELCGHFGVRVAVCVNKWDINPAVAGAIEDRAKSRGAVPVGRIPYDRTVTAAQLQARATVELGGPAAEAIGEVWLRWKEEVARGE